MTDVQAMLRRIAEPLIAWAVRQTIIDASPVLPAHKAVAFRAKFSASRIAFVQLDT